MGEAVPLTEKDVRAIRDGADKDLPIGDDDAYGLLVLCEAQARELAEARRLIEALPRTADDVPIVPGMSLHCEYLGSPWTARVVAVAKTSIDVQYTNDASHSAQWATARNRNPKAWLAATAQEENDG